jgi:hypothetical protein
MTGTSPTAGLSPNATTTVTDIHCSLIPKEFLTAENFRMAADFRARAGSLIPPVLFPAAELLMEADFLILAVFLPVAKLLMAADLLAPRRQVFIPVRSAASIMEALRAHCPRAEALASAEAFTVEGASMAEEATGEHDASTSGKSTDGERNDARNEE